MRILFILIISIGFFLSCSTRYEAEIATIDSLLVRLDSSKKQLHSLDTGLVYKRMKMISKNLKIIHTTNDTIDRDIAFVIDDYANCNKMYSRMSGKLPSLFDEIETIPRQLENLKTDLSKNLIEKEKAGQYLMTEQMAATTIIQVIDESIMQFEGLDQPFNESHEKILHLIQSLEESNENDTES